MPHTVFVPSAVCQSDVVLAHRLPEDLRAEAEQEAGRHQREQDHVEGEAVAAEAAPERHREREGHERDDRAGGEADVEGALAGGPDRRRVGEDVVRPGS